MHTIREGSLEAPTRHPIDWQNPEYYNEAALFTELERIFDICHGCRRCVSLCGAFPTLFDLVDESQSMEIDTVAKNDYWKVVEHCYLCDLCYLTKCPYVPPHEWNLDFPHTMLRAKAVKFKNQGANFRDKLLSNTETLGRLFGIPVISSIVNSANANKAMRGALEKTLSISKEAVIPKYYRSKKYQDKTSTKQAQAAGSTTGKVAIYRTCYGRYNDLELVKDLIAVYEHNDIIVKVIEKEECCGMPKLELGDLNAVAKAKEANSRALARLVDEGWDLVAPIPSCTLMYRQELPLMFPADQDIKKIQKAFFDPFEYLMIRHKHELLKTTFKQGLGKVAYQVACHQRVQRIGNKTHAFLSLIPDTTIEMIERCSGHDGTYAVKKDFHKTAKKLARPIANQFDKSEPEQLTSDCIMAGHHITATMNNTIKAQHPMALARMAYGI